MDQARWLETHQFLAPIARFQELVERAIGPAPAGGDLPAWEAYGPELERGVPLLASQAHGYDPVPAAAEVFLGACARLAEEDVPAALIEQLATIQVGLRRSPARAAKVVAWALAGADAGAEDAPPAAGLASFVAWMSLRRVLAPVIEVFATWRGDRWTLGTCPTCGAQPSMAQLVAAGDARQRRLACGRCATRWRYRRLGCPHCPNEEADRLSALETDDAAGVPLRVDCCDACKGYVKTYAGEGDEGLILSDWTTLHLDVLAAQQGFRRAGASLYAL